MKDRGRRKGKRKIDQKLYQLCDMLISISLRQMKDDTNGKKRLLYLIKILQRSTISD